MQKSGKTAALQAYPGILTSTDQYDKWIADLIIHLYPDTTPAAMCFLVSSFCKTPRDI